jgi:hypothetical protein
MGLFMYCSVSSSQPSATLPAFTISNSLIKCYYIYRHILYTATYSFDLWRRVLCVSWSTKLAHDSLYIYWQVLRRQTGWRRETGTRSKVPDLQHWWILGVGLKPYIVKHKLFQIPKRSLGYVDMYQGDLRARKWSTGLVLGMCEFSLKWGTEVIYKTELEL